MKNIISTSKAYHQYPCGYVVVLTRSSFIFNKIHRYDDILLWILMDDIHFQVLNVLTGTKDMRHRYLKCK